MDARCSILEGSQDKNEVETFISAIHAERTKVISKEMMAKVWHISGDELSRMSGVTLQQNHQNPDSSLSRKIGTNNYLL